MKDKWKKMLYLELLNKKLCKRESISNLNQKIGKMYLFVYIFLVDMIEFEYMALVSQ